MTWVLFLITLLSYFAGAHSQQSLTQPATLSVSPGQTAKLPCTVSGSVSYFHWVRQRLGQGPHFVVYGSSTRGEGISGRFTDSSSGSDRYLTISNAQAEDEADYSCAAYLGGGVWIFGGGTTLLITGQPTSPPTVHLFPPSKEEMASKNKATLVCLVQDFIPGVVQVSWEADGTAVSSGVETTKPTKHNDKYMASSYLTMTPSDWESHDSYTCKVKHEGADYVKSVSHLQCP